MSHSILPFLGGGTEGRLTIFGAKFLGKSVTSHVQNGPRMYLLTTDLSMPEYLYASSPAY